MPKENWLKQNVSEIFYVFFQMKITSSSFKLLLFFTISWNFLCRKQTWGMAFLKMSVASNVHMYIAALEKEKMPHCFLFDAVIHEMTSNFFGVR